MGATQYNGFLSFGLSFKDSEDIESVVDALKTLIISIKAMPKAKPETSVIVGLFMG
jgi:hypothetical protein